ncbi:hypothetical protein F441_20976 [Phytophthora nicotianae CJ01A1]|uniref:Uncharacterized protein n=2 Tax=Phytophthora nicotianae TaxID=4792 RepID=W2VVV3_PHYNI|nr:hypothetical protein F441_20976 [Phytophthora nicotianae CJ01A1]
MLQSVEISLQHDNRVLALEQSSGVISRYLGPPILLPFHEACRFGSTILLDWIWNECPTRKDARKSFWCLTNYLRSDPYYHRWQFEKSLEVAASRGDLHIVKWLFEHFSGCEAPESVVYDAVRKGHLCVLQFLWGRRSGQRPHPECSVRLSPGWLRRKPRWGATAMKKKTVENDQLLQCLDELGSDDLKSAIKYALEIGDTELAQSLVPVGKCVLDYATGCSHVEVVNWLLDCGYLRLDAQLAVSAIENVALRGSLELLQQIFQLHSPLPDNHEHWAKAWGYAILAACTRGHVAIVQWLVEHHLRREACENISTYEPHSAPLALAAKEGHVAVMQYLFDQGLTDGSLLAMHNAIDKGQVSSVEWLLGHFSFDEYRKTGEAIDKSAEYGHLAMLEFFHEVDSTRSYEDVETKRRRIDPPISWWVHAKDPIYWAAKSGHIEILEWIQANRSQKCLPDSIDIAAKYGHLEVTKWLHQHRTEGCTNMALVQAAKLGHLMWSSGCI